MNNNLIKKYKKNDGSTNITTIILTIAPLAISEQREPIISTLEIRPTPNVAAKNPRGTYDD